MIPRYCDMCGAAYRRVAVPCPEGIPGCAVFHFKLVCPTCDAAPAPTLLGGGGPYCTPVPADAPGAPPLTEAELLRCEDNVRARLGLPPRHTNE